ncbi:integral membrane protein [Histoplasma ohiense]|nr:integral membrane protein [Histoplasma ohiense (nom. inval.)]
MRRFLFASTAAFTSVVCQSLIPTTGSAAFPGCAVACPLLHEAQANCVPPAAPVTNQATYSLCFCQSTLLRALRSSPNRVCDAVCPPTDLITLQKWYAQFCATGNPATTTATSNVPESHPRTGTVSTVTHEASSSWFSSHWRWVVMIIALAVGFTVFALLLIYLKRRHKRKRANQQPFPPAVPAVILGDGSRSAREPTSRTLVAAALADDKWGPQQHLAHTRAQGPGNADSTPNISNRAESGQFTRAPQRVSRNMRGPSRSKD